MGKKIPKITALSEICYHPPGPWSDKFSAAMVERDYLMNV